MHFQTKNKSCMSVWTTEGNIRQNESLSLHSLSFYIKNAVNVNGDLSCQCLIFLIVFSCVPQKNVIICWNNNRANNDSIFFLLLIYFIFKYIIIIFLNNRLQWTDLRLMKWHKLLPPDNSSTLNACFRIFMIEIRYITVGPSASSVPLYFLGICGYFC